MPNVTPISIQIVKHARRLDLHKTLTLDENAYLKVTDIKCILIVLKRNQKVLQVQIFEFSCLIAIIRRRCSLNVIYRDINKITIASSAQKFETKNFSN